MRITSLQIDNYLTNGFAILEGFVEPSECDVLRDRAVQMVQEFDPSALIVDLYDSRTKPGR